MKKLLPFLTLLFAIVSAVNSQSIANNGKGTTDMWDFVTSFNCSTGRQHGVVYDGEYLYTSAWGKSSTVLSMFYKYDLDGNLIEEFDVPGIENSDNYLRDMTYDGQYVYGCDAHSGTIWCYDLRNKTLVGQINTGLNELGHCTYDPNEDAFWVGERATGNSPDLYLDLKLVDRNGAVIYSATDFNLGGYSVHGTGYFIDENNAPHIYLFAVQGFTAHVFDYNIENDSMEPNYIFDFSVTPGWGYACSAGGAYIGEYNGTVCFFGDVDKSPNLIGIYALGDYTPEPPEPPTGDQFYDFNDGFLRWTTIDADGDGYVWDLNRNWTDPSNPYSAASASRDDMYELPLTPDNYLVSPWKLTYGLITFKACAQDAAYPEEHFGVAVSTTGNTDGADFTTIWETTMTVKAQGQWYEFAVDLRAYEGQEIWVALRHFGCTDQFMIVVDDITLYREWDNVSEDNSISLNVYPNPTSNTLGVESEKTISSYDIFDMMGNQVCFREVGSKSFQVDVDELPAGTYMIRLMSDGMVQTKKFIKK